MDERFQELEKKMDERFKEFNIRLKKVNERLQKVDRRFDEQEIEIRGTRVQLENATAITRNCRLRRMHQPVSLTKVLRPTGESHKFV